MATPLKPWESKGASGRTAREAHQQPSSRNGAGSGASPPPTLPPRPNNSYSSSYAPMRPYGPSYQSFGSYGAYGGIGGYGGGYGGYGYRPYGPYGGYGYNSYGEDDSQFIRQAEESTRTAFQSVESVVGAFASISTMLESTYFAVHSCFRALLGVAQHFTRLRNHLWSVVSTISLLRRLQYWLKRLLRMLHLRQTSNSEETWEEVALQHHPNLAVDSAVAGDRRLWPVAMFFVMVFGIPWLLWKLLSSVLQREDSDSSENTWTNSDGQPVIARALYDFNTERSGELSFLAGDELVLAPRQLHNDWLLAGRNRRSGLVPANYLQILPSGAQRSGTEPPSPIPQQELLHDEENLLND